MLIKGISNETQYCYWCNKVIYEGEDIVIDVLADEPVYCNEKCHNIYENYINHIVECADKKIQEKKNKSK